MSGVRPEPLALEVAVAHYVASMPEGESVALSEVAQAFGCEVRELQAALVSVMDVEDRDMVTISGVTVRDGRIEKYVRGGYERDFQRPVRISPVQARAALLALDLVSGATDPGVLGNLRNKILGSVGADVSLVEVGETTEEDASIASAIEHARRERLVAEIRYPSSVSGEVEVRPIEPLLMSRIEGIWYVNAFCRRADAGRTFRLERILSVRLTDEPFEPRGDVELKTDYRDLDPRGFAARRAVVRFSPAVARWMEERPELDLLAERPDGSADYALHYTDPAWAARRVMQYLGEAVVLEPPELREEVRRTARTLLASYGEAGP